MDEEKIYKEIIEKYINNNGETDFVELDKFKDYLKKAIILSFKRNPEGKKYLIGKERKINELLKELEFLKNYSEELEEIIRINGIELPKHTT